MARKTLEDWVRESYKRDEAEAAGETGPDKGALVVIELARSHTTDAIKTLVAAMNSDSGG